MTEPAVGTPSLQSDATLPPGDARSAQTPARLDGRLLIAIAAPLVPIAVDAVLGLGNLVGDLVAFPVYCGLAAIAPWIAGRWRWRVIAVNAALGAALWTADWALTGCRFDLTPRLGVVAFALATFVVLALEATAGAWIAGRGRPLRAALAFAAGVVLAIPMYFILMVASFNLGGPPPIVIECIPTTLTPDGAGGLEAVVVTVFEETDELGVEGVAPYSGRTSPSGAAPTNPAFAGQERRTIAVLPLSAEAAGLTIRQALFHGETNHLAVWTRVPDPETSLHFGPFLVYDLGDPSKAPVALSAGPAALWGPDGRILFSDEEGRLAVYDVVRATTTDVTVPEDMSVQGWAADGSGLLAGRYGESGFTLGVLGEDGRFLPGPVRPYVPAGTPIGVGANGEIMVVGHGDPAPGGTGYDFVGVREPNLPHDQGPALWYQAAWNIDPKPIAFTFDRAGTGIWLLLDAGAELRLTHLAEPEDVEVRATLPDPFDEPSGGEETPPQLTIVGISPDETVVLLQRFAERLDDAADLYWLDLAAGSATKLTGWFAGWVEP